MYVSSDAKIIFVLGSVRSGTSAVGQGLDHAIGSGDGYYEGNLIGLLPCVSDAVDKYYRHFSKDYLEKKGYHQVSDVGKDYIKQRLLDFLLTEIVKPVNNGGKRAGAEGMTPVGREIVWVDKSPDGHFLAENARSAAFLAEALPNARFIFCRRHGVANVESRIRKWGRPSFITHCHGWAAVMDAWWTLKGPLNGRFIEVDQYDLATEPDRTAEALADFVSANEKQRNSLKARFSRKNVERTSSESDALQPRLIDTDWTWAERLIFALICGEQMRRYRYNIGPLHAVDGITSIVDLSNHGTAHSVVLDEPDRWAFRPLPGGFQLHALPKSRPPAMIRLLNVPSPSNARLSCMLVHAHQLGPSVLFGVRLFPGDADEPLFEKEYTVAPGEALEVSEVIRGLPRSVKIEVTTRLTPLRNDNTFARARIGGLGLVPLA